MGFRLNIKKAFRKALKKGETKVSYNRKLSLNELCELAEHFSLSDIIIGKRKLTLVPAESAEFIVKKDEIIDVKDSILDEAVKVFNELEDDEIGDMIEDEKEALVEPGSKAHKKKKKKKFKK